MVINIANKKLSMTNLLITITVLVYIIEVYYSRSLTINNLTLYNMGAMVGVGIQNGEYYRLITPIFLHIDLMHILFNMVALYSIGYYLEELLGKRDFLLLYLIGGYVGNLGSYYFSGSVISAGASTSIFGLFVAGIMVSKLYKYQNNYMLNMSSSLVSVVVINLIYTLMMPSVSISGHVFGAIGGFIGLYMLPNKNLKVWHKVRLAVWLGLIVVSIIILK